MTECIWIEEQDALFLHDRLLALYGGSSGVRDLSLLQSALARPRLHAVYATPDIVALAALYATAIVRNHPFVDGNKRTAFVVSTLFLELNGYVFSALEEEAAQAMLALAAGLFDESGYESFLRDHSTQL